jgi:aspartate/methionine/tyrosine aminotransferase
MTLPTRHRYSHVAGIPPLLEQIRAKLAEENRIDVTQGSEVVVTAGGNMAFVHALLAIADPGDEIILQAPYYFNHEMAIRIAGCKPVIVPTDRSYQVQVDAIHQAITARTRAVVTISPNNPTGAVYEEASLRAVNALCQAHGVYHISDEAYEYFTYDGAAHFSSGAISGAAAHTLSLYSLSKAYGMAAWRIGYMVLPAVLLPAVKKIQDTILICPPVPSQFAALGAMEAGAGYCRQFLEPMAAVRHLVLDELARLGPRITVPPVRGAFYVFVKVDTTWDALALVRRLIREYGVAVIPGTTFGMADGCYLRIAYGALQRETVAEAMGRLGKGLSELVGR